MLLQPHYSIPQGLPQLGLRLATREGGPEASWFQTYKHVGDVLEMVSTGLQARDWQEN
jgi:hypothetical protein